MFSDDLPPLHVPPGWTEQQLFTTADTIGHPAVATEIQTCGACPEQWDGTLVDGRHFYYRLRHGSARLGLGDNPAAAVADAFARSAVINVPGPGGLFESAADRRATFGALLQLAAPELLEQP